MKRRTYLLSFIQNYCADYDYIVWCPDHSSTLYDRNDLFVASMSNSPLIIFNCMLVDSVCVNGDCLQINCSFNSRKWNKQVNYYNDHVDELPIYDSESFF